MARTGLFDVPGHERGSAGTRRTLRLDREPELRGPPGAGRPHPSGQSRHGRRRRRGRAFRRRAHFPIGSLMQAFTTHKGLVAPLDRENVDTDLIIPKQFLKSIKRTGFGPNLFDELRYLDHGEPGMDNSKRPLNPEFSLNKPRYQGASILLTRKNFGCGSSREHAPWALDQYGLRAIIAPSYADIFFNNSFKNGLLPIVLSEDEVSRLFEELYANEGYALNIDLPRQVVVTPEGREIAFEVEPFRKHSLLNGLDEIATTLQKADKIRAFESERLARHPWLAGTPQAS